VAAPLVSSKDVNMARRKLNLASIKLECAREEVTTLISQLFTAFIVHVYLWCVLWLQCLAP